MQGRPATIGELKASEYRVLSVKDEMRKNLIARLRRSENPFSGIIGYEERKGTGEVAPYKVAR